MLRKYLYSLIESLYRWTTGRKGEDSWLCEEDLEEDNSIEAQTKAQEVIQRFKRAEARHNIAKEKKDAI